MGGQPHKKNTPARAEDRKPSHPNTGQMSDTLEARRATPQKPLEPNRTPQIEPRWFKPLENDSILIIFFVLPVLLLERGAVTQHAAMDQHVQTDSVGSRSDDDPGRVLTFCCCCCCFCSTEQTKTTARKGFDHRPGISSLVCRCHPYLLGLLAKIKCSICSYQLNLWYLLHGNK